MKNESSNLKTIYFIYIGEKLPQYALASIQLAKQHSGMNVHLIGSAIFSNQIKTFKINFTAIEKFYNPNKFKKAINNLVNDKHFRDGLWVKTLERFFILEQFMTKKKIKSIFHSEIDQLLFRTDKLVNAIIKTNKKGIFIPFHSKNTAVASVIFINKLSVLHSLIQTAGSNIKYSNEMDLIAQWSKINPKMVFALPTLATEIKGVSNVLPKGLKAISAKKINGIVDAAQLGLWVGGIDPKNVNIFKKPTTKYVDKSKKWLLSYNNFKKIKLELGSNKILKLKFNNKKMQLYNLHLHSKIHQNLLHERPSVSSLILYSNLPKKITFRGTRFTQLKFFIVDHFNIAKALIKNPYKMYIFLKKKLILH